MRILSRRAGGLVGLCGLLSALAWAAPAPGPRAALDTVFLEAHRAGRFDGVVLVGQGPQRVYERAFGLADRERQRPHVPEERFRWASVTRQLTALLILQEGFCAGPPKLHGSARDPWRSDRALMSFELLSKETSQRMWAGEPELGYEALGVWSYPASFPGCPAPLDVVERQVAVILLSNTERTEYGAIWEGKGLAHDVLRTVLCAPEAARP